MEEGVSDRKDDNNEKNDEEKQSECPDDTPPIDIEEGVKDINDEEKIKVRQQIPRAPQWMKVKE